MNKIICNQFLSIFLALPSGKKIRQIGDILVLSLY